MYSPSSLLYTIGSGYFIGTYTILGFGTGFTCGVSLTFHVTDYFMTEKTYSTNNLFYSKCILSLGVGSLTGLGVAALVYQKTSNFFFK